VIRSLLVLAIAGAAASTPTFVFDKPSAAPHEFVVAKTVGKTLKKVRKRTLRLYLGNVHLGFLNIDRKGNGRLRFEVPNVPPGAHRVLLRGLPGRPRVRQVGSFRVLEPTPPVRGCDSSVYGRLDQQHVERSQHIGPLILVGYVPDTPLRRDAVTGEYPIKVLLAVERGAPVTLAVVPEQRRLVALSYIPERFNRRRVQDGDPAVTFVSCRGGESVPWASEPQTQFNGGFVFKQPLCAHFTLAVEGDAKPISFALPFGKPC
jgi:hypothetical protein